MQVISNMVMDGALAGVPSADLTPRPPPSHPSHLTSSSSPLTPGRPPFCRPPQNSDPRLSIILRSPVKNIKQKNDGSSVVMKVSTQLHPNLRKTPSTHDHHGQRISLSLSTKIFHSHDFQVV
ncbi:unnamed protein product [Pleuronectes platessa]|uniref:Uncharacterized protein n=1 Tax=Pleuronectes platessa TaxID=8262 RepID=A0A9N7YTC6_PLEPL|nr:unnamed protein product [Pleuronectes platessa]